MPSFDITSEVNMHELTNALDQANREITNRFDFKDSNARYELKDKEITMRAPSDFQIHQMMDILQTKMAKRQIDIKCLDIGEIESSLSETRQKITIKQGIDKEFAKKITKLIKESKVKVQTSIQEEQIRVTGKKRDELQEIIALLRNSNIEIPLQYVNFRD